MSNVTSRHPAGYEKLSVSATAVASMSVPSGANYAIVSVFDHGIAYRDDGTAVTSAAGYRVSSAAGGNGSNGVLVLDSREKLVHFQAQAITDSTAAIDILYYKPQA